jgi:multiple sugar transport system substrate-binding protein
MGVIPAYGANHLARRAADTVTLQWWNEDWGVFDKPQASIGDAFTQSHPNIKVVFSFNPNQYSKLETAIAAGAAPDCAEVTMYSGNFAKLVTRGALLPLDQYFKQDHISLSEFGATMRQPVTFNGHIYALPADFDAMVMYYNKDMFRKVGLDPNKPPTTWAELQADSAKFYKVSNGNVVSIGAPISQNIGGGSLGDLAWTTFLAGGSWYDAAHRKITATNPANVRTLQWLVDWGKQFDVDKVTRFTSSQPGEWQPGNPFVLGKQAFFFDGWWASYPLDLYGPSVDYGVAYTPTPDGTAAERNNYPLYGWTVAIPKGSPHPEACWQFEKWGFHDHDDLMALKTYSFPAVLAQIPSFWNMLRKQEPHDRIIKYLDIFNSEASTGRNIFPIMPVSADYYTALNRATDLAIHGKMSPQAALQQVQSQMQTALDKFYSSGH